MAPRLLAHRERQPPLPTVDPRQAAKQAAFVRRVLGPPRDPDLEARLPGLAPPTLALFGTLDAMITPDMGDLHKELIPDCHLVFVDDAGHAIAAERPEAFTEVVGDFLDRHDAFVISRMSTVIHPYLRRRSSLLL